MTPDNMNVTRETFIRELPLSVMRRLSLCLDRPLETYMDWRGMAALLPRRPGVEEPKYNAQQISMFAMASQRPGGSPTESILQDWSTTNARVSDLLKVFAEMEHLAAMDALLPGSSEEFKREEPKAANHNNSPPAKPIPPPLTPSAPPDVPPRPGEVPKHAHLPMPADSTMLPSFDPQTVQRFSYEEIANMTGGFDQRKVKEGGCLIDEGGFGVVFKGRFSGEEPCAVKKLKQDVTSEEINVEGQFDNELKALCRLRHPNLVILYGYCYEPPQLCFVYELITGGSLRDRLACKDSSCNPKPLSWPSRLYIAWGSACGICFLHEKGFIHRDIKSANILLDANLTAKICDFGLVRDKSGKKKGETSRFQTSLTIGSTAYMAREAHSGEYSKKTDVYSFGVVLLEILTGLPVCDETHILTKVDDLMDEHNDVVLLIDKHAEMSEEKSAQELYDLASQCTEQKARRRPDIGKIVERLEAVQGETPPK